MKTIFKVCLVAVCLLGLTLNAKDGKLKKDTTRSFVNGETNQNIGSLESIYDSESVFPEKKDSRHGIFKNHTGERMYICYYYTGWCDIDGYCYEEWICYGL